MSLLDFVTICLAAWRMASLLVYEQGPFHIFARLRARLVSEGELGFIGELFVCVYCMAVWTAVVAYLAWWLWPVPVIILAISAMVVIVEQVAIVRAGNAGIRSD